MRSTHIKIPLQAASDMRRAVSDTIVVMMNGLE
jgi:hypothetical protein